MSYAVCAALALLGLHGMSQSSNLLRRLMALNVLQVAVIAFYLLLAVKTGAEPPVLEAGAALSERFINPLPHALMLTAIVVSVATTGVGLALLIRIHRQFGTLEDGR